MMLVSALVPSPLGDLTIVRRANGGAVTGLYFPRHWPRPEAARLGGRAGPAEFADLQSELDEYFAGRRREFSVPIEAAGDDWERRVWALIAQITYGRTRTYGELAAELGDPTAARDVGAAVGRNPLSIVVPCHRVVGKGGALTGYAGGLTRKRQLLDLERAGIGAVGMLF